MSRSPKATDLVLSKVALKINAKKKYRKGISMMNKYPNYVGIKTGL